MFITLGMAREATLDRSGRPPTTGVETARVSGADGAGVCARLSSAVRIRPVRTIPATKPDTTKVSERKSRLIKPLCESALLHVDASRRCRRDLGQRDRQDAVMQ